MIDRLDRIPPQDQGAEMCVLGAMMLRKENIPAVCEFVAAEDFYFPRHSTLFRAMCGMFDRQHPIDLVTLRAEMERQGLLQEVGGYDYLCSLADGTPNTGNMEYYAKTVREKAGRRRLITLAQDIDERAYSVKDFAQLQDDVQSQVYKLGQGRASVGVVSAGEAVEQAIRHAEKVQSGEIKPGLMTGFAPVDDATGGLQSGDLVTLAAATGVGKSALAMSIAQNVAREGGSVLYVSAEMESREMGKRLLQSQSGVPGQKIRYAKQLTDEDWTQLQMAAGQLASLGINLLCRSATVAEIVLRARELASRTQHPLSLIVVDYLQLMRHTTGETRAQQVGGIAWGLKQAAMDLGTPILMLSQFDRAGVKQIDVTPTMHNLKESGDIENHSNTIILLHQPANLVWDGDSMSVWCRIAKARDGMVTPWEGLGAVRLWFKPSITRFVGAEWAA